MTDQATTAEPLAVLYHDRPMTFARFLEVAHPPISEADAATIRAKVEAGESFSLTTPADGNTVAPAPKDAHSLRCAVGCLGTILERVAAMKAAEDADDAEAEDEARQSIHETPYALEVRDGWRSIGQQHEAEAEEFRMTLAGGGPACQIMGELSQDEVYGTPELQHQDWGTPWTALEMSDEEGEALSEFCRVFYFGEG